MPKRDSAPIGAPCWVDLFTSDLEKSRVFYAELFGWTAGEPDEQFDGYVNFTKDGVPVAGRCVPRRLVRRLPRLLRGPEGGS